MIARSGHALPWLTRSTWWGLYSVVTVVLLLSRSSPGTYVGLAMVVLPVFRYTIFAEHMDEMWTDITSVNIARVVDRVAGRFIAVPFAILLAVSFLAGGIGVPLGLLYLLARFITWAGTSN